MVTYAEVIEETKKKKKKANSDYINKGAWDKAEEHTENDPPGTNYKKNISARRGFVGGT